MSKFTFQECMYIQAPALMVTLPKMKLNRNASRAIVHGRSMYGGLKFCHTYCEQGNGQLQLLLGHWRNKDHTGQLIRFSLSYLQMTVGSTKLALNLPYPRYHGWIESTWLTSVWAFLDRIKCTVELRQAWTPTIQWQGDAALMTFFLESGYKRRDLEQLNSCRLYHQVFFLSDIVTADGSQIDAKYRDSARKMDRTSTWKWPRQGLPDRSAWRLWNNALRFFEQGNKLRVQMGDWIIAPHQQWRWQYNLANPMVRQWKEGRF